MVLDSCRSICKCATCVYNPYYAVNTPQPCGGADCDICEYDCETVFCNHYFSIEDVDREIRKVVMKND